MKKPRKNIIKTIYSLSLEVSAKIKEDRLAAYASESTLFITMSIMPFTMLLITLLRFTPITEEWLTQAVKNISPDAFDATFTSLIHQMYSNVNLAAYLIMIFSILWTVGKGFHSIVDGLNSVYRIHERRNWFLIRLISILYTLIFIVGIVITLALYVLGHTISDLLVSQFPFSSDLINALLKLRILIVIALLTLLFTLMYIFIPRRHQQFRSTVPGAVFAALGWTIFSYFFSIYVEYSKNLTLLYGSLTTIICTMLWLYTCMYIFLAGAEANIFFEKWFLTGKHHKRRKSSGQSK